MQVMAIEAEPQVDRPQTSTFGQELRRWLPFLSYLLVQAYCIAGLPTSLYPDSVQYLPVSFTGNAPNLPTVPVLYWLLGTDPLRICGQVLIAAIAWWLLAKVASSMVEDSRVRLGLRLVLLALGLVGPIVSWNSTILSESTALSLTALLIAGWLAYARRPSWRTASAAVAVSVLWTFTRQAQVILSLLLVLFALVAFARKRSVLAGVVTAALLLNSVAALVIVGRGHYVSNGNIADVIEDRILPNTTWTTWFAEHGMPYDSTVAKSVGGQFGDALLAIPSFDAWLTADSSHVYEEFMLTHPVYTFIYPLPSFSGELASLHEQNTSGYSYTQPNPTPSMLSPTVDYGRYRAALPTVVENLLFDQGDIGDVLLLAAIGAVFAYTARRRFGRDRRRSIPLLVLLTVIPNGYLVWLAGGPGEVDRNSMELAASLRIALWVLLAFALDGLVSARWPRTQPLNGDEEDAPVLPFVVSPLLQPHKGPSSSPNN